jgi:hypothetical protein
MEKLIHNLIFKDWARQCFVPPLCALCGTYNVVLQVYHRKTSDH